MTVKNHGTIDQTVQDLVAAVNGEAGTGIASGALPGGVTIGPTGAVAAGSFTAQTGSGPYASSAKPGWVDETGVGQWGSGVFNVQSSLNPAGAAKGDAQEITDAVMTIGSAVVNSVSGKFKSTDVGKTAVARLVGAPTVANPTVAIIAADGGAGATTLPTGTYKFAYCWATRGFSGETTIGTSEATYVQATANHIITLTVPAVPANAEVTELFVTAAPGGAFTGFIGLTKTTTFAYTTGNLSTQRAPIATTTAGATIQTTIASYQSATQVTLATTATLGSLGASFLWGTDDSASRDAAVTAALAAGAGEIVFPPPGAGSNGYLLKTGTTINAPLIHFRGLFSKLYYTGSGDCFRVQLNPFDTNAQPGSLTSLVVDGNYAQDGASGVHYGDAVQGTFQDLTCSKFNGVGSKGIWMDNRTNWTERHVYDRVWVDRNTIGIVFDINGGNNSFGHNFLYNFKLSMSPTQIGMQLKNNAALVNSVLHITGNGDVQSTTIQVLDTATLGFSVAKNFYAITMEDSGPVYAVATGLDIAVGASLFGVGTIDMSIGNYVSKNAFAGNGNIQFSGWFNCPGIYTPVAGESLSILGFIRALNQGGLPSLFIGDPVAVHLHRTAGALGGLLAYGDQNGAIKARIGISAVDNHAFVDDGATEKFGWNSTGVSFYGVTPVARAGAIATPNAQTGSYVQADVTSLKTAIDAIRVALQNVGITS